MKYPFIILAISLVTMSQCATKEVKTEVTATETNDPNIIVNPNLEGHSISNTESPDEIMKDIPTGTLCVDSSKITPGVGCIALWEPVCGCNGKTYSNTCYAKVSGVQSYVTGECKD